MCPVLREVARASGRRAALTAPGLLGAAILATLAGCASAPAEEQATRPAPSRGVVSFEQLKDPSARSAVVDADHEYVRPRLESGFTMPSYPPEALAAGAPPQEVVVRLLVATDGSVASIVPSPLAAPPRGEWAERFLASVVRAVSGWRYDPCELRTLAPGPDLDGDGKPDFRTVVAATPVPVYLDIAFRFEIVDGAGQVSMG